MLRIVLFVATNLAIIILLGIVMSILGVDSRSTSGLLVMAAIFGMGGSFISLAMSKWIAKKSTGAQVIVNPSNPTEQWLFTTVRRKEAGQVIAIIKEFNPTAFYTIDEVKTVSGGYFDPQRRSVFSMLNPFQKTVK